MDTRRLFAIKLHNTVQFYQQRASASTLLATRAAKWAACFPLAGADPEEQHVAIAYGHLREYVSARRCDQCILRQHDAKWAFASMLPSGLPGRSRQGGAAARKHVTAGSGNLGEVVIANW